jgi:integrase
MTRKKTDEESQQNSKSARVKKRGQGEGSIYQRKDGRWVSEVQLGYSKGKRDRKFVYGKTRKEAADKLTDILNKQKIGLPIIADKQTVQQFLEQWLEDCIKPSVRLSTYLSYEQQIRLRIIPEIGHIKLSKLTPQHIQKMLNNLAKISLQPRSNKKDKDAESQKMPSAKTINYQLKIMRMALSKAESWGLVARNVAKLIDPLSVPKFKVEPINPNEAKIFLKAIEGDRLEALFAVALALGLRRGESLALKWSDVDLDTSTLRVTGTLQRLKGNLVIQPPKTEKSERVLDIPKVLLQKLREHRTRQLEEKMALGQNWQDTGLVFTTSLGTPIDPRNVKRKLDAILKSAKMRHYRIHDLRHFFASLLLAQGVELKVVSELLGHSDIRITDDIYTHVLPSLKKQTIDLMDKILTGTN